MLALASSKEKFLNEDFKFQIVACIEAMLKSADDDLMKEFYKEESKLPISHLVFTSLEWMEQEKSPRLKLDCIAVLDALLERRCSEFDNIFHALLPGNILYMLCNINVKLFDRCLEMSKNGFSSSLGNGYNKTRFFCYKD